MNNDEICVKSSEVAESRTVQVENEADLKTPYYWGWYRCIFSRKEQCATDGRSATPEEK